MKQIFYYLKRNKCFNPQNVDRLFVSAFITTNNLNIENNIFLKNYIIDQTHHDEFVFLSEFIQILSMEKINFDIEKLIELFEFVVSPKDRIVNGAIYTPTNIREYIILKTIETKQDNLFQAKIADISCGCGGFLFNAAKKIKEVTQKKYYDIFRDNIFGIDIQEYSIIRTKILLSLLAVSEGEDEIDFNFNLFTGNTLSFIFNDHITNFNGFDIVVGNPPYVCSRHMDIKTKRSLEEWSVCKSGHPDLYIPFFQIALENLSPNGILGFITMNSFFKSLNGRGLREYFQFKKYQFKIIDFGAEQIFKSRNTYTCICIIQNCQSEYLEYTKLPSNNIKNIITFENINYCDLDIIKGWNLNKHLISSKIESTGIPLGKLYTSRHGIATLKNNIYIFKPVKEDLLYYYLNNNSTTYLIEKDICKDIINSNKLSRETSLDRILEKIIFPYSNDTEKTKLLDEKILETKYPYAYKYLLEQKYELSLRDKGLGKYENWYAFGRTQSLEITKTKLFFPKISDKNPHCIIHTDENLFFYNGQAFIGKSESELLILKKIIESKLFWYYIQSTSKPYSSNYYSLNGNYIKNFGVYEFTEEQKIQLLEMHDKNDIDTFLFQLYDLRV